MLQWFEIYELDFKSWLGVFSFACFFVRVFYYWIQCLLLSPVIVYLFIYLHLFSRWFEMGFNGENKQSPETGFLDPISVSGHQSLGLGLTESYVMNFLPSKGLCDLVLIVDYIYYTSEAKVQIIYWAALINCNSTNGKHRSHLFKAYNCCTLTISMRHVSFQLYCIDNKFCSDQETCSSKFSPKLCH